MPSDNLVTQLQPHVRIARSHVTPANLRLLNVLVAIFLLLIDISGLINVLVSAPKVKTLMSLLLSGMGLLWEFQLLDSNLVMLTPSMKRMNTSVNSVMITA